MQYREFYTEEITMTTAEEDDYDFFADPPGDCEDEEERTLP